MLKMRESFYVKPCTWAEVTNNYVTEPRRRYIMYTEGASPINIRLSRKMIRTGIISMGGLQGSATAKIAR